MSDFMLDYDGLTLEEKVTYWEGLYSHLDDMIPNIDDVAEQFDNEYFGYE